jgi:protoheme IX farnesyltransferase
MNSIPDSVSGKAPAWQKPVARLRAYWTLIKGLQTGLLLVTAAAGYASGCCMHPGSPSLLVVLGSLLLAIGGCTVLNMYFDRDLDPRMSRTAHRPLPTGMVSPAGALYFGLLLTGLGLTWSFALDPQYGALVSLGVFLNVAVYTVWLKRRTPFAIVIGGLAGGMPALAARTLVVGKVDLVGLLLDLGILLWIPSHMLTFSIKYADDYRQAGIATFPAAYGVRVTRLLIAFSSFVTMAVMLWVGWQLALPGLYLWLLGGLGAVLSGLTLLSILRPSGRMNFVLYKGASIYMLSSMLVLILGRF